MSRLVNMTVDQIRAMSNSEVMTSLEILKSRIGSGRKNNKPTKDLEKTYCYVDDERQRRQAWGMLDKKEKRSRR
mgnify:CR=1 FL=1